MTNSVPRWQGVPPSLLGHPTWPSTPVASEWRELFGRQPSGIVVVIDDQVGAASGQLRSLPLLRAVGIQRFAFPPCWRGFDLVPYTWVPIDESTSPGELTLDTPLCLILPQAFEDDAPADAAYKLLGAHRSKPDGLVVFVFDTARFSRRLDQQLRPFVDEYALPSPLGYQTVFRSFIELRRLAIDQVPITWNPVWHALTGWRRTRAPVRRLADVFDRDGLVAEGPVAQLMRALGDRGDGVLDAESASAALRPWIDNDLGEITRRVFAGAP